MGKFVMAGPSQAIGFVVLFAVLGMFLPPLGILSGSAVALITLRLGWSKGLQTLLIASAALAALSLIIQGNPLIIFSSSVLQWLPVLLMAVLLKQTSSWSYVLGALLLFAMISISVFYLITGDPSAFWQAMFKPLLDMPLVKQQLPSGIDAEQMLAMIGSLGTSVVGVVLCLWFVFALMIARHWQAALYNPGGFGTELREIQLAGPLGIAMAVLIIIALLFSNRFVIDLVAVGMTIFLFQGISLVHDTHQKLQLHTGWLVGFYIVLFIMPVQFGVLLAAFGIIDSVANFRSQIRRRSP